MIFFMADSILTVCIANKRHNQAKAANRATGGKLRAHKKKTINRMFVLFHKMRQAARQDGHERPRSHSFSRRNRVPERRHRRRE